MVVGFVSKIQQFRWVMQLFLRSFLTIITVLGFSFVPAQAETFYWQDDGTQVSLSFPDTWRMVHDQKADDVLTIVAPSDGAFPMCRMRVREDRRSVIFPRRFADEIQRVNYSRDFWEGYAGEFRAARLDDTHDDAGLGRGFGSYAHISFISDAGPRMKRRGIAMASSYRDKAFIFECSAEESVFEAWSPLFRQIARTVDFRKEIHELPGGHYRHFPADGVIRIHNAGGKVASY